MIIRNYESPSEYTVVSNSGEISIIENVHSYSVRLTNNKIFDVNINKDDTIFFSQNIYTLEINHPTDMIKIFKLGSGDDKNISSESGICVDKSKYDIVLDVVSKSRDGNLLLVVALKKKKENYDVCKDEYR